MRKAFLPLGLCVVVLSSMTASAVAWGQSGGRDEARAHFATGEARFKAGDYGGAIKEFRAADHLVPSPLLTYNVALCYDKLGDARQALAMYREYLDRRPEAPNRPQVETRIAALSGRSPPLPLAAAPPVAGLPPGAPAPEGDGLAPPRAAAPPSTEPRKRVYDDSFARRLPTRAPDSAEGDAATAPPVQHGDAEQAPPVALNEPPGRPSAATAVPPAPLAPAPPLPEAPRSEDKPIYKQWWFWTIIGVSAIIVVDVAVNSGSSSSTSSTTHGVTAAPSGLALFHF